MTKILFYSYYKSYLYCIVKYHSVFLFPFFWSLFLTILFRILQQTTLWRGKPQTTEAALVWLGSGMKQTNGVFFVRSDALKSHALIGWERWQDILVFHKLHFVSLLKGLMLSHVEETLHWIISEDYLKDDVSQLINRQTSFKLTYYDIYFLLFDATYCHEFVCYRFAST